MPATCFGPRCGKGITKIDKQEMTNVCEPIDRRKILSFKNIWFKIHTEIVKYRQYFVIIQEYKQSSM